MGSNFIVGTVNINLLVTQLTEILAIVRYSLMIDVLLYCKSKYLIASNKRWGMKDNFIPNNNDLHLH